MWKNIWVNINLVNNDSKRFEYLQKQKRKKRNGLISRTNEISNDCTLTINYRPYCIFMFFYTK